MFTSTSEVRIEWRKNQHLSITAFIIWMVKDHRLVIYRWTCSLSMLYITLASFAIHRWIAIENFWYGVNFSPWYAAQIIGADAWECHSNLWTSSRMLLLFLLPCFPPSSSHNMHKFEFVQIPILAPKKTHTHTLPRMLVSSCALERCVFTISSRAWCSDSCAHDDADFRYMHTSVLFFSLYRFLSWFRGNQCIASFARKTFYRSWIYSSSPISHCTK